MSKSHRVAVVTTAEQLDEVVAAYSRTDEFAFDVETWGERRIDPVVNAVSWLSLSTWGRTDVIAMGHPHGEFVELVRPLTPTGERRRAQGLSVRAADHSRDDAKASTVWTPAPRQLFVHDVFSALKPVFMSDARKVGHNVKFDVKSVAKYLGEPPAPPYADTMVAAFLLDSRSKNALSLDACVARELGYAMAKGVGKDVTRHAFSVVARYSHLDAKYTWLLWRTLEARLRAEGLERLFALEMDVTEALCPMELTGALLDVAALGALRVTLEREVDQILGDAHREAGRAFNPNSNAEKQALLFTPRKAGGRGLRPTVRTSGGKIRQRQGLPTLPGDWSVAEDALRVHEGDPLVDLLLAYANRKKILSTYVMPYLGDPTKARPEERVGQLIDGRLHGDFNQIGAESGRFASRWPNLQNIPNSSTPLGRQVRDLWIAGPGHRLVVADYSQIEPRVIASFSQDPAMLAAYHDGADIYLIVGSAMGVDRPVGKVLVLSIAYGIGPEAVAKQIGCTLVQAKDLMTRFAARFKAIDVHRRRVVREASNRRPTPYVETMLRRRRYLPDLVSRTEGFRRHAERQCYNHKIQGSAADIIKIAMVRAHRTLPEAAQMILSIHDEIVTVTPEHLAEETAQIVRTAMEGIDVLSVPLLADVKIVDTWGAAK